MAGGRSGAFREVQALLGVGPMAGLSDAELLGRFASAGGEASGLAFEALVLRHGPMVLRVCRDVLGDPDAAQDAWQATFVVLARRAKGIGRPDSLGNWLHGVARRVALKAKVQAARRRAHEGRAARPEGSGAPEGEPDRRLEWLHEEIARLPARERAPVVLCHLEGLSYEAAARSLGVTEGTIRGRLARARDRLRGRLARRVADPAGGLLISLRDPGGGAAPSSDLLGSALRASIGIARGGACPAGATSPTVSNLAEGVLKAMHIARWKTVVRVASAAGLLAVGAVVVAQQGPPARPPAAGATGPARPDRPEVDPALAGAVDGRIVRDLALVKDCMVLSYLPGWAHGEVDNLAVADNDGGVRALLDWPDIPPEDLAAPGRRFLLALYSRKTTTGGPAGPVLAFEVIRDWPERTSWGDLPDYAPEPSATTRFAAGEGWKVFDLTAMVRAQAEAGRAGRGVLLRFLSEDRSGRKRNFSGYEFVSREGAGEWAGRRPRLLVVEE